MKEKRKKKSKIVITYDSEEENKAEKEENVAQPLENVAKIKDDAQSEVEKEKIEIEEENKDIFSKRKISICFPDSIVALHQVFLL